MILAGIDIGTNTLRLLIAETGTDSFHKLQSYRRIARLGQHLDSSGMLSREARERSIQALADFHLILQQYQVVGVSVVGTSALRNASNSAEFIEEVNRRTGLEIRVVSGEEEARLTLLGVAGVLQGAAGEAGSGESGRPLLIIDIGGGSTEIILDNVSSKPIISSLPLGAVYVTERFIKHDPPLDSEVHRVREAVKECLDQYAGHINAPSDTMFVGTAGTITTLASMDQKLSTYDPERIHGYLLSRNAIERIIGFLAKSRLRERRDVPGLEPGREDIILAGALITREIADRFAFRDMLVSDWGLLEGIVFDLNEKLKN